jgi:hypothetical protein
VELVWSSASLGSVWSRISVLPCFRMEHVMLQSENMRALPFLVGFNGFVACFTSWYTMGTCSIYLFKDHSFQW